MADKKIPLAMQIRCVTREIAMRRRVYPRWVADKRMTQADADHEIATMEAVLETIKKTDAQQGRMFDG